VTLLVRSFVRAADADQFAGELAAVRGAHVAALATATLEVPTATEAELRDHARITARVHRQAASLPARFGVHYESQNALARAIGANERRLARELDEVGLRNELSIILSWRSARPRSGNAGSRAATSGREYLLARAASEREKQEAESLVARLVAVLAGDRAVIRQFICPRDGVAATVAVLTTREGETAVRERADRFARETDEVTVAVYGPMPPYSFVS